MIKNYVKISHPVLAVEYDGTKKSIDDIKKLSKKDKTFSVRVFNDPAKNEKVIAVEVQNESGISTAYGRKGQYVVIDKTAYIHFFVAPKSYFTNNYQEIK